MNKFLLCSRWLIKPAVQSPHAALRAALLDSAPEAFGAVLQHTGAEVCSRAARTPQLQVGSPRVLLNCCGCGDKRQLQETLGEARLACAEGHRCSGPQLTLALGIVVLEEFAKEAAAILLAHQHSSLATPPA